MSSAAGSRVFSVEVFPPKTEQGIGRLDREFAQLASLSPAYVSVTCAAGPEASERTYRTVVWLRERTFPPQKYRRGRRVEPKARVRSLDEKFGDFRNLRVNQKTIAFEPPPGHRQFVDTLIGNLH